MALSHFFMCSVLTVQCDANDIAKYSSKICFVSNSNLKPQQLPCNLGKQNMTVLSDYVIFYLFLFFQLMPNRTVYLGFKVHWKVLGLIFASQGFSLVCKGIDGFRRLIEINSVLF